MYVVAGDCKTNPKTKFYTQFLIFEYVDYVREYRDLFYTNFQFNLNTTIYLQWRVEK